ncbi:ATP-binding protein [Nocardiopsis quinghaiensis]|uniref:ATP-binding protein n=1 Tax=Nocardiopsis quinghaiensis TaxID=464995 RepID=UPI0012396739|nr:ATP-binding protein [Nocardiopsis quinghaiensis]
MVIVPQTSVATAHPERRWEPRLYPETLATTSRVRSDLRTDLARLTGLGDDLVETVVLCASEMFANAVEHSRSGEADGRVIRTLAVHTAPDAGAVLRLSVIDDGAKDTSPLVPRQRTAEEWRRPNPAVDGSDHADHADHAEGPGSAPVERAPGTTGHSVTVSPLPRPTWRGRPAVPR